MGAIGGNVARARSSLARCYAVFALGAATRRHRAILQVLALLVHCLCTDELVLRRRARLRAVHTDELGGCSRVWTRECARLF